VRTDSYELTIMPMIYAKYNIRKEYSALQGRRRDSYKLIYIISETQPGYRGVDDLWHSAWC